MGLRARSYFKLEEIDHKFHLVRNGQKILDLGAAPGSWTQYVLRKTGGAVGVTAVDISEIEPFGREKGGGGVFRVRGDVFEQNGADWRGPFDLVLSDMAPRTNGYHGSDAALSAELVEAASTLALEHLKAGGFFVAKYLQGAEMPELQKTLRGRFGKVSLFKPESSRQRSSEVFFVCLRKG